MTKLTGPVLRSSVPFCPAGVWPFNAHFWLRLQPCPNIRWILGAPFGQWKMKHTKRQNLTLFRPEDLANLAGCPHGRKWQWASKTITNGSLLPRNWGQFCIGKTKDDQISGGAFAGPFLDIQDCFLLAFPARFLRGFTNMIGEFGRSFKIGQNLEQK